MSYVVNFLENKIKELIKSKNNFLDEWMDAKKELQDFEKNRNDVVKALGYLRQGKSDIEIESVKILNDLLVECENSVYSASQTVFEHNNKLDKLIKEIAVLEKAFKILNKENNK